MKRRLRGRNLGVCVLGVLVWMYHPCMWMRISVFYIKICDIFVECLLKLSNRKHIVPFGTINFCQCRLVTMVSLFLIIALYSKADLGTAKSFGF